MRKWLIGLVLLLLPIWAIFCAAPASSPDSADSPPRERLERLYGDSGTYWLFRETRGEDTFYGIMRENGEVVAPANYIWYRYFQGNRLMVEVAAPEHQLPELLIVDEQGQTVLGPMLYFGEVSGDFHNWMLDAPDPTADVPFRTIYPQGDDEVALFDIDGVRHGDNWRSMSFRTPETVIAENDNGLFLLDLEGQIIRRLDEVQTVDTLFDGRLLLTKRDAFLYREKFGVRTPSGQVVLEEKYKHVFFLSDDRIVGANEKFSLDTPDPDVRATIFDSEGRVVCDRYNQIEHPGDGRIGSFAYYPAAITGGPDSFYHLDWYLIDQDGDPVNEEPFVDYRTDSENPSLLFFQRADGSSVTWSRQTGRPVA